MATIKLVSKESMWYAIIFVLNVILITASIMYSQTTINQTIIKGNERLEEIEKEIRKVEFNVNERKEKEVTIIAIDKGVAELQRTINFRFAEIEGRIDQWMKGSKEQMEQRIGEIKTYFLQNMQIEFQSLYSSLIAPINSLSDRLSSLSFDQSHPIVKPIENIDNNNNINNIENNNKIDEMNNKNNENNNIEINNDLKENKIEEKKNIEEGKNNNEKKIERRVEKYEPIKDNHKSEKSNLHMVLKGNIDKKSIMGIGASFLSHFTTLHLKNLTINRIDRIDLYYESSDRYPNGFSIIYDLDVSNFRSSPSNPSLDPSLQKRLQEIADRDQTEQSDQSDQSDQSSSVLVCDHCKLIAHAKIPLDFNANHPSSFPSLLNHLLNDYNNNDYNNNNNINNNNNNNNNNNKEEVYLEESLTVRVYDPSVRVNFITTSFNVSFEFERQLGYIKKVYERDRNIRWIIVDYPENNTGKEIKELMKTSGVPHLILPQYGNFNKVRGLNAAAELVTSSDEILFFLDIDMYFDVDFSHTIRSRTFQSSQVFYPICFSFYSNGSPPDYRNGFYREGGIGNLGIFQSDFLSHRWTKKGQNEEKWGKEDNYMFDALSSSKFVTYRTYEPLFFHLYHEPRLWHS